jgi:DNA ligase-1
MLRQLPTLFKRTVTGKIQSWAMEYEGDHYRTISGQTDGEKVVSKWTVAKPKNSGRSNATSSAEQAQAEAVAAWQKKLRDGYSETEAEALGSTQFQCMLAPTKAYDEDTKLKARVLAALKAQGLIYQQPKLDGGRCLRSQTFMLTRKHRPILACPHIAEATARLVEAYPGIVLDGELYNHEFFEDFNRIMSMIRSTVPTAEDLEEAERYVQYWLYDVYLPSHPELTFTQRNEILGELLDKYPSQYLIHTETTICRSVTDIDSIYDLYIEMGFEGSMLRTDDVYDCGRRSPYLSKRKQWTDAEYVCLGIYEGEGNRSGEAGYAVFALPGGGTFSSNIKGDQKLRLELLNNSARYIGKTATVQHHPKFTPDGKPRFPRVKAWWPEGRDV